MQNASDIEARLAEFERGLALLSADNESLRKENERLSNEVVSLTFEFKKTYGATLAENEQLKRELAESKETIRRLTDQIRLSNARAFGQKSEKGNVQPGQIAMFNEVEATADTAIVEPLLEECIAPKRPHRRGGKRKIDFSKYETVVIDHVVEDADRVCPQCGDGLSEMKVELTRQVRLVPAHLVVEEHRRHVYICKTCSDENAKGKDVGSVILRAPMPTPPIPNSFASPSMISWIVNAKYMNAQPLYRIEKDLASMDMQVSRQTMSNWILDANARWFSRVVARMKEKLLENDYLHADETEVQVLKEPGKEAKSKSRMWVFCAPKCSTPNIIFEYHPTRSGKVARAFLDGWKGTIMSDGYEPYFKLGSDIQNTACLVHVRRKFIEVVKSAGTDELAEQACSIALAAKKKTDAIFQVDAVLDDLNDKARSKQRNITLRPLMEEFYAWAKEQIPKALPKSKLDEALKYAVKYWPYVMHVLDDGRFELSNNIAERAIRPFVIGRKNWEFCNTPKGAQASAAIYSIVETAKANGLNARKYIDWLLTEMPNTDGLERPENMDRFMPWSMDALKAASAHSEAI